MPRVSKIRKGILEKKFSEDSALWVVLWLYDIKLEKRSSNIMKFINWIITALLYVSFLYLLGVNITCLFLFFNKLGFNYLILVPVVFLLWRILSTRSKRISKVLHRIYAYRKLLGAPRSYSSAIINIFSLVIPLLPLFSASAVICAIKSSEMTYIICWSYSYEVSPQYGRYLVAVLFYSAFYTYHLFIPALVALLVCTIEFRCAEILKILNKNLGIFITEETDEIFAVTLTSKYFKVVDILEDLEDLLSTPLFLFLICNIASIFPAIYLSMEMLPGNVPIEMFAQLIVGVILITTQTVCASLIPENLKEIRKTATRVITKLSEKRTDYRNVLYHLTRIEKKEIICMTACGMIQFDKYLILGVFGTILTYGLLIINIK